jgi:hypothetical protein
MTAYMAFAGNIHEEEFDAVIGGVSCHIRVGIQHSFEATIDFIMLGKPYTFFATKWRARKFGEFLWRFHETPRDPAVFGTLARDTKGILMSPGPTVAQKITAVVQACKDILVCVDRILATHGQAVLDYAVWYTDTHREEDSYSAYIAKVTCRCIVQNAFLAPNAHWELVQL